MCGHSFREHVIAFGRLEVGVTEEIGGDRDLLRSGIDQLGHGAMPEQVRPDGLAEGLLGVPLDLTPDRSAAHRPAPAVQPEVVARADETLGQSTRVECLAVDLRQPSM